MEIYANGGLMKGATQVRVILVLGLTLAGARALLAAEAIGDGQEQARLLLSGRSALSGDSKAGFVVPSSTAAKSIAVDGQAQAREMILGREIEKTPFVETGALRVAGARRDRGVEGDPHEMARQMILGSPSAGSPSKIRLTTKAQ
jgi:hypothetical protein